MSIVSCLQAFDGSYLYCAFKVQIQNNFRLLKHTMYRASAIPEDHLDLGKGNYFKNHLIKGNFKLRQFQLSRNMLLSKM